MYRSILAVAALTSSVLACPDAKLATDATGWNCYQLSSTQGISYQNVGGSGTYQQVTGMDMSTGTCTQKPVSYSGPLGPLSEELSVHFRGPINLKRFAAYSAGPATPMMQRHKHRRSEQHLQRHRRHASAHQRRKATHQKRACGDWVTATYPSNGPVFSFQWEEGCPPKTAATPPPTVKADVVVAAAVQARVTSSAAAPPSAPTLSSPSQAASSSPAPAPAPPVANSPSNGWTQTGFYDSSAKTATGLTFLANVGSGGTAGIQNALTYVSSAGTASAPSAQVLADTLVPSSTEFAIYSSTACSGGSCPYSRPDVAAYHGFAGTTRAFAFEFGMPDDPNAAGNNMPAIWFLNAQLARTQQYALQDSCKCWPACGEVDVFETLAAGEGRAITAIHGGQGSQGINGGSTNWFTRPKAGTAVLAVLFQGSTIDVQVLDSFDWGAASGEALVAKMVAARAAAAVTNNGGS